MTNDTQSAPAHAGGDTLAAEQTNGQTASFADFPLPEGLLQTLSAAELTVPTPIQQMAIPHALEGRDLIGLAQTGTGKTAAFLVPILAKLPTEERPRQGRLPKALILSPTRELATQIASNFIKLSAHTNLRQVTVCGGMRYDNQIRTLRKGVDVVIATPGRLEDLMERGAFDPDEISYFVMDEADHMLDLGFYPPMKRIFASLPEGCQTMLFSATMPPEIATLATEFLNDPHHVTAPQTGLTVDRIKQQVTFLSDAGKRARLQDILGDEDAEQALIFVRTKRRADVLADMLSQADLDVDVLHGDLRQSIRQKVLRKFREGKIQAVIATDVAARGIDVSGLSLVINYDLTDTPEAYIHRVGRTGRAGQSGLALSFCAPDERRKLAAIIEKVGNVIELFEADGSVVEDFSIGRRGSGGRSRPPAHIRKRSAGRDRQTSSYSTRRQNTSFEPRPEFSKYDPVDDAADNYQTAKSGKPKRNSGRARRDERGGPDRGSRVKPYRGNRFDEKSGRQSRQRDDEYSREKYSDNAYFDDRAGSGKRRPKSSKPSRNKDRAFRAETSFQRQDEWSDAEMSRRSDKSRGRRNNAGRNDVGRNHTSQTDTPLNESRRDTPRWNDKKRSDRKPFSRSSDKGAPKGRRAQNADEFPFQTDNFERPLQKPESRRNKRGSDGSAFTSNRGQKQARHLDSFDPSDIAGGRDKPKGKVASGKPKHKLSKNASKGAESRKSAKPSFGKKSAGKRFSGNKSAGKQGGFGGIKRRGS